MSMTSNKVKLMQWADPAGLHASTLTSTSSFRSSEANQLLEPPALRVPSMASQVVAKSSSSETTPAERTLPRREREIRAARQAVSASGQRTWKGVEAWPRRSWSPFTCRIASHPPRPRLVVSALGEIDPAIPDGALRRRSFELSNSMLACCSTQQFPLHRGEDRAVFPTARAFPALPDCPKRYMLFELPGGYQMPAPTLASPTP